MGKASDEQVGGGHYKDYAIQPAHFNQVNKIPWCEANAIKYACRHRSKNGRQDLEKAIHYLQLALEWEYGDDQDDPDPDSVFCGMPAILDGQIGEIVSIERNEQIPGEARLNFVANDTKCPVQS